MDQDDISPVNPEHEDQSPIERLNNAINDGNAEAKRKPKQKEKRKNWPQLVEAMCAIMLVFITGYYAYYARKQRDAMLESNKINRESLQSVQRAFMRWTGISNNVLVKRTDEGEKRYFEISTNWENSGNTPATEVVGFFEFDELKGEPDEVKFRGQYRPEDVTVSVVGPKGPFGSGFIQKPATFFLADQANIPQASLRYHEFNREIFFWGWVVYRDVFPGTSPHITEFCQQLIAIAYEESPNKGVPTPRFTYQTCHRHNCVDKYCDDYQEIANMIPK